MTTKDIRRQMMDRMNGTAADDDEAIYEALPMTYSEAVRRAKGIREELGLCGFLVVTVQAICSPGDMDTLEWRAFYQDDRYSSPSLSAKTAHAMLKLLRAHLESYASPATSLESVGSPDTDFVKGN